MSRTKAASVGGGSGVGRASPAGMRSALATATLKDMGMDKVCHIEGGYGAWKKWSGRPRL